MRVESIHGFWTAWRAMRIFIDESGNFTPGTGVSRTCCVAALIVPEKQAAEGAGQIRRSAHVVDV
jgi:hypothetical protein